MAGKRISLNASFGIARANDACRTTVVLVPEDMGRLLGMLFGVIKPPARCWAV